MKKMYVIIKIVGQYEISYQKPIGVCEKKAQATKHYKKLKEQYDKTCELAIKNIYGTEYDLDSDNWKYARLCEEFNNYIFEKYFPHVKDVEEFTKLEYDLYKKLMGNFDSEEFIKWCFYEKGLSQEIIDATIEYNNDIDYDTIQYYIEETILME